MVSRLPCTLNKLLTNSLFTSFRNGVVSLSCFPLQIRWWFRQIECSTILADGLWNSHLLSTSSYSFDCGILGDQEWEDPWECQIVKVLCRLPWSWSTFCPQTCHCHSYWNFPEWSLSKVPTMFTKLMYLNIGHQNSVSINYFLPRDDFIFIFSMFTSFLAFILTALFFNERKSNMLKWIFLSGPMYSAIFACRAFTLAVYLKETLYNNKTDAPWALFILLIMFSSNIGLFRWEKILSCYV